MYGWLDDRLNKDRHVDSFYLSIEIGVSRTEIIKEDLKVDILLLHWMLFPIEVDSIVDIGALKTYRIIFMNAIRNQWNTSQWKLNWTVRKYVGNIAHALICFDR